MPVESNPEILTLTNTQAKQLAGSRLTVGTEVYHFKDYDPDVPGQPPWFSGAEGKAYPLVGLDGSITAYLKFFGRPTQKRLDRTAWLIGQQIHKWLPGLRAAPLLWTETPTLGEGAEGTIDFSGYLAHAVPGKTWLEVKNSINETGLTISDDLRWRCIKDLILSLAALEQAGIAHGDLSPNNVVIDLDAPANQAMLYLIDFDAFAAPAAGANEAVAVAEGGSYGTDGYCPPDLTAKAAVGDTSAAPYSDRYGRDMLLLELLFMDRGYLSDDPPAMWNREELRMHFVAWKGRTDAASQHALMHLDPASVFPLSEQERPSSIQLAKSLSLRLPKKPVLCPATDLWRVTPAIPGHQPAIARVQQTNQKPETLITYAPKQRATPALLQTLNPRRLHRQLPVPTVLRDIILVGLCLFPLLVLLLIAILNMIFGSAE